MESASGRERNSLIGFRPYGTLGGQEGALGQANQSSLISGASAALQGATLQQQNDQQQDTAAYNQYMAGLSYPYQNIGFLSNIVQGIGSQEGNTSTTQGNALSSIAGLGTSAIGIMGATGAFGSNGYFSNLLGSSGGVHFAHGGSVRDEKALAGLGDVADFASAALTVPDLHQERGLGSVGDFAAVQGADLAARMARADGGAALGLGARPHEMRPARAMGGPLGLGFSPVGGTTMPDPALAGLGARPRFDVGGVADDSVPLPSGGLNVSPSALTASGGFSTGPGLGVGHPIHAAKAPADSSQGFGGAGLGALTASPNAGLGSAISFNGPGQAGLGAPVSFSGQGQAGLGDVTFSGDGTNGSGGGNGAPSPGFGGISQNGWMGIMAAGLGMMGGTSASATANIGQGALGGLKTYLGLEQQDKSNAVQQQKLVLEKQAQDNTAAYQQGSLALDQKKVDLSVKQLEASIENAKNEQAYKTGVLANSTATTASENATRDQARQLSRYQTFYVPGVGGFYRDLLNPGSAPIPVGSGQSQPDAPGATPPPTSSAPAPAPAAAPPPPGGVSASGAAPPPAGLDRTIPGSYAPVPALAAAQPPAGPSQGGAPAAPAQAPSIARAAPAASQRGPQSGSALVPSSVPQGWKPTTAVPQGYVPANSMNIAMSPDGGKSQAELGQKEVEGLRANAGKATNAQQQLYQMNAAVDALPKTGLLSPGAFGDERVKVAGALNGIAQTFGADPLFKPDQIADTAELQKGAFRLGTQMITDTNGGREAGFILQNSVRNVPSINNNYLGFKRVAAGIDQANQYTIDKANFVSNYYAKYHHVDGADAAFNKLNPWQNYAQRAIDSSTMPSASPSGVPAGSAYSMSRQQWRGPDGTIYGADGQKVQ